MSKFCFDETLVPSRRWQVGRFAAFREMIKMIIEDLSKYLMPGDYLSIDKTLWAMWHHIGFCM